MRFNELQRRTVEAWRASRCGPLVAITLAGLVLHEEFPFSHFPMYSSFTSKASYVYLASASGEPLPTDSAAGMHTSNLKKLFDSELQKERKRRGTRAKVTAAERTAAAQRVLGALKSSPARQQGAGPARLYEVNISLHDRRFDRETVLLAEAP
ncbi:MAG: hypothetical protein M3Z22_01650 [Verrucomicrobiota bacterium]|nr:hypothetical protein [Verrucomicrobiota bacterium]